MWQKNLIVKTSCVLALLLLGTLTLSPLMGQLFSLKDSEAYLDTLPKSTQLLKLSPEYNGIELKGLSVDPNHPEKLKFIVDSGDEKNISESDAQRLLSYFFTALSVPEDKLWVNLSPYESERIIDDRIEKTDLGRDFLVQDYLLKQISASLTHPESQIGRAYWSLVNSRQKIDNRVFNKVWIAPKEAAVAEIGNAVYVTQAKLDVLSEKDYFASKLNGLNDLNEEGDAAVDSILPKLKEEINNSERFARLRQIYKTLILAKWFKYKFQNSFYRDSFNTNKVQFLETVQENNKDLVYSRYKEAFEKGVYQIQIKDSASRKIYFSGGLNLGVRNLSVNAEEMEPEFKGSRVDISCSAIINVQNRQSELIEYIDGVELNPFMIDLLKGKFPDAINNVDDLVVLLSENEVFEGMFKPYYQGLEIVNFSVVSDKYGESSYEVKIKKPDQRGGEANIYEFLGVDKPLVLRESLNNDTEQLFNAARSYLVAKILAQEDATPEPIAFGAAPKYVNYVLRSDDRYGFFSVSEYGGPNLRYQISHKYNYDVKSILTILQTVFEGLSLLHSYNMPHADIKPQNILIDLDNKASLIDFSLTQVGGYPLIKKNGRTDVTPEYLAPELMEMIYLKKGRGYFNNYTKANDIYALGCVIFEMITGKPYWNVKLDYRKPNKVKAFYEKFNYNDFMNKRFDDHSLSPVARYLLGKMLNGDAKKRLTVDELISESEVLLSIYESLSGNEHLEELLLKMTNSIPQLIAEHEQKINNFNSERNKILTRGKKTVSFLAKLRYLFVGKVAVNLNKKMRKELSRLRYRISREENRIKILKNELVEFENVLSSSSALDKINGGIDLNGLELNLADVKMSEGTKFDMNNFLGLSFKINSINYE